MQAGHVTSVHVRLESPVARTFRCQRAADSLDIDTEKKAVHELHVDVDLRTPFNVGLVVGASGSGKTTLALQLFGDDVFASSLDPRPIIEQFPKEWSYDECAAALSGVGLTAVPCWIRPAATLSNGQRARAEAALLMARGRDETSVVDEWTSVVDRTVAKAMSHCIQKHARRTGSRIILLSCHYDVVEWLNPDWIIDCNTQSYTDRRSLWRGFERSERLTFEIAPCDKSTWRYFARYHYLSDKLAAGAAHTFGLFAGEDQVGFTCFSQYVPPVAGRPEIWHGNRTVIHPDYVGLGLGRHFVNTTCEHVARMNGWRVMGKFSSEPMIRWMKQDPNWKFVAVKRQIGKTKGVGNSMQRGRSSFRENVRTVTVEYIGPGSVVSS